jgi:hypothetical protein
MVVVVCEKHQLRYDAETQSGCVVCRREAATPEAGGSTAANAAPVREASAGGLLLPLAVAGSIWLLSAAVLFVTHQSLAAAYLFDRAEREAAQAAAAERAPAPSPPEIDANAEPPGSLDDQTDQAVEELRAQRVQGGGNEPPATGTGAPSLIPSSEQLSQPPSPINENEEPTSNEPVVIETGSGSATPAAEPPPPPPSAQP